MTIGRHAICGYTSPGSAAPRSTVRSAAPGLSAARDERGPRDRDAVLHRELGELLEPQPGPDRHLDDALADLAQHRRERVDLVDVGEAARHRAAERALVVGLARRREADRAGSIASRRRSRIVRDLVVGRGPLLAAEHEQPQRRVADERADVEALVALVERVEVLGERLEAPVDALVEGLHRHALDVLERAHDRVAVLGPGRRDREAAVAHHHAGDAVPARRREVAVPEDLRVVVGVDVDEAGREHEAVEVDHLGAGVGLELARARRPR